MFFKRFQCKKKHLILTRIIIWNHLIQKLIVLVAEIITSENFFSLHWNSITPLSLLYQKRNEKKF
jgi:hypothetical protein